MKRLLVLLLMVPLLTLSALAADSGELARQQMEQSGANSLSGSLPKQAKDSMGKMGISGPDPGGLSGFTPASLFSQALAAAKDAAERPFRSVTMVFGILLACALLNTLKGSFGEKPLKNVFDTVCALCIAAAVLTPVSKCISSCCSAIRDSGNFSLTFLPVFTGLVAASGHPASAAVYHALLLSASQLIVQLASTTFIPLVSVYLALCVVGSVSPDIKISGLSGFAKKFVVWGLTLCITVFVGILTIQGLISNAEDTVSIKAAKFMVGSFVPVIGSAVSDALNTVIGCAGLLKTATGAYAILAFVLAFLPSLLECLIWMLAMDISAAAAEILSIDNMAGLLKSIKEAVSIMLALVLASALALIVSTSVMLLLGTGN